MELTNEEIGKEFKLLWKESFKKNTKEILISHIRGYFNLGMRANKLIRSLEE